ncbi:hypothetical protein CRG49_001925 [Neisseria sp. N95_16]|uniref:Uncharacterized protein n=1 Tax=Neisseria brasiliensis TaxID=2666100 RepID=A0A5Q3S292_9NEIS|nr:MULTISPECIES: hypothetical protein [Neisseria]MRN38921.1 hypothetical protein [Neisseria brasiliensis]PJO10557.1 hypothetical protein CRG49_001925 [Neisseria sp. N95_16]PJO77008.1 hypothetical protein CWC45_12830 [Neisseria sp. N177_16]QGL26102.1 hypothetical protein GJV52_11510 [Neisseria brasiliensis]
MAKVIHYIRFTAIGFDQFINTLLGGYPDETLSARVYRNAIKPDSAKSWLMAMAVINKLFFWQANHCRGAYNQERERNHSPKE